MKRRKGEGLATPLMGGCPLLLYIYMLDILLFLPTLWFFPLPKSCCPKSVLA
jgi:hypothetical protein